MASGRSLVGHAASLRYGWRWRLFVGLVAVLGFAACDQFEVSDRIGAQVRSTGSVDLAAVTHFAWTQVRIYTPCSTRETVCKDLGAWAPDCLGKAPVAVPESEYLLVFVDGGKAVRYVRHDRRNGNFQSRTGVLTVQHNAAVLHEQASRSPHQGRALYLQPGL